MTWRAFAKSYYVGEGAFLLGIPTGFLTSLVAPDYAGWAALVAAAYGVWRGATVRVRETEDALVVRNVLRTVRVPWRDLRATSWFEPMSVPRGFVVPGLRVSERRWRVPVHALVSLGRPSPGDRATVRRWAARARE